MDLLLYIFIGLVIISAIAQFLLYKSSRRDSSNLIYWINMLLGILISIMAFTGLPSNYIGQRVLAASWAIIAMIGMLLQLRNRGNSNTSKIVLTIGLVGGLVQLILGIV